MSTKQTLREWVVEARHQLEKVGITSYAIDAELILCKSLDIDRTYFRAHDTILLTPATREKADTLLKRRCKHEPLAFLLGIKEFYGRDFLVDNRVLIPRGESEILIETAVSWLRRKPSHQRVAEIGTGSGALILTLAAEDPRHHFLATDISPEALAVAHRNMEHLNPAAQVDFFMGDLGTPLLISYQGQIDLLVTNLPYIPAPLLENLDPTVRYYEPHIALDGGQDGLELYRRFLPQAQHLLKSGGLLLCEHERDQGDAMRKLAKTHFPDAATTTQKDGLGDDRLLVCQT